MAALNQVLRFFMVAVTIIVVAVPEGLPMAIFIALGLGMRKIREDNNLVRKMVATETIGSATVICSDKTGTLTKNRMAVTEMYFGGKAYSYGELAAVKDASSFELLATSIIANSTAEIEYLDSDVRYIGNATEAALLHWLSQVGRDYRGVRNSIAIHDRISFSTDRKMMSSITGCDVCAECPACAIADVAETESAIAAKQDGCRMVFTKGAPEKIFDVCTNALINGKKQAISECHEQLHQIVDQMARRAVRPLAIAYKVATRQELGQGSDILKNTEQDLTLLAIVGINDEIREDVPYAIKACREAGIEVKMITGDHPLTAQAVAQKIGMMGENDIALTEEEFDAMTDEQILEMLPQLRILSRAKPVEGKKRLVELLQQSGHVVAVTGDGVNDVPALKTADVGLAMGMKGTEVAKEASDIILTDDNFGSIVRAVHWGRTLYENLQKFLQFQLTVNLSALGIAFISPIVGTLFPNAGFSIQPLTVLQYLWINLIMDTLAAIAFGLEPPRKEAMNQPPRNPKEPFLTSNMLLNIVIMGTYFIGLLLLVQATDLLGLNQYQAQVSPETFALMKASLVFNAYVFFQVFQMFNARSVTPGKSAFSNITKSRSFFYVMGFVVLMQILLIQFGGKALNTTNLPFSVWLRILALGASAIAIGELLRFLQRKFAR
jgi:Ca2+-transporting ATPase